KNGLEVDTQNRNAARLSRMPGVVRNGKKQFLMATNIGKGSWAEWEEWIEGVNDDLPDPEPLIEVFDNLPPLSPPLIEGVLRQGHKMLMAGPSKAGKSFALIGLTIAIAEGSKWFGWQCTQGRVLYVNLELDRASALHRFKDVYKSLGIKPKNLKNIDIWNLRGKVVPMDKLAPKLIRRAQKQGY
ncbi:AAA family ATPase, partial [Erysipelothrix rhusiopathiae]|nr:AAA family ATPase [Erysipelothrix rhusiopathiae]